jgi:lysophospholipase L1-like esterase
MVRRARELRLGVYLADVLPWNNGWPAAEPKIRKLNALVRYIAAAERVPLLGFHDALEDAERPGRMREDWTSDGDHPSIAGYRILGELVAQTVSSSPS